jgi:hypothetical protein
MKLNNSGWGLPHLMAGIAIIIAFLLVAFFYTLRLDHLLNQSGVSNNISKTSDSTNTIVDNKATPYYVDKITLFTEATNKYITNENIELEKNNYQKIDLRTLIYYGYIDAITDYKSGNDCNGYALADLDSNNIKEIKVYLSCDNYISKGYGD